MTERNRTEKRIGWDRARQDKQEQKMRRLEVK